MHISLNTRKLVLVLIAGVSCCPKSFAAGDSTSTAPSTSMSLTLQQCLTAAMANPDNADRWKATQDQAFQNYVITKQEFKPTVTAQGAVGVSSTPGLPTQAEGELIGSSEHLRGGVKANYTVWDGGKRSYDLQAARAMLNVVTAGDKADQLAVLRSASDAYYNALWSQRGVDSAQQMLVAAQQNLKDAQARYDLGTAIRSDVLTATTAVDTAKTNLSTQQDLASTANTALAEIINADPNQTFTLTSTSPPEWTAPESFSTAFQQALAASPQKAQLEAQLDAAQNQYSAIHAQRRPVVSVNADAGWASFRNLVPPFDYVYSPYIIVGANVTLPLMDEQRIHASELSQTDAIKLDRIALDHFSRTLEGELTTALANYRGTSERVDTAQDALSNASQAYDFTRQRYEIGKATQTDVVEALQTLMVARDQSDQALAFRDAAAQNLRWLVGLDSVDNIGKAQQGAAVKQ